MCGVNNSCRQWTLLYLFTFNIKELLLIHKKINNQVENAQEI